MSLILEALKKSEAERRLGQVPGLMTPVQRAAPRRDSRMPLLIVLLLAIALAVLAGWWWMQREAAPSAARDDARRAEAPPPAAPTNPPPANEAAIATPAPAATTNPTANAPAPTMPAELPSDPDFVSRERESRPVAANTPEPIDAEQPTPRAPPQAPAAPAPRPAAPTPRATPDATAQTPATQSPLAAPEAVAAPPAAEETLEHLPRLVDLPASERDALPPLKLTMHVYAADASARFVLIDGQRLGQGERLSPTLTLSEIRRDGAVFESDGRRFLIPRL